MIKIFLLILNFSNAAVIKIEKAHSIYKKDDRSLVRELSTNRENDFIKRASGAILAQVSKTKIQHTFEHEVLFNAPEISEALNLCPESRFKNERTLSSCTSFLIKDDVLLTAGHSVEDITDCQNNIWILDYNESGNMNSSITIPQKNIFKCERIIKKNAELDFVIIKLDRSTRREPLKLRTYGTIKNNDELFMIGHPMGLPQILVQSITPNVKTDSKVFTVDADAFSGNSGSPLINAKTNHVEGILIKGALDFERNLDTGCLSEKVYETEGQEKALKISEIPRFKY